MGCAEDLEIWVSLFETMGRGRGKGKKLTVINNTEDPGSGGEEPVPAYKRRGRPQKPLKDDVDEEENEKMEEEEGEDKKLIISNKEMKPPSAVENGRKRKRQSHAKENPDSQVKEENSVGTRTGSDTSTKSNGFRQNGSRRKSKPRRAAESVVECK
ncbi:hypothetical protein Syun_017825 [Stephania yunnanensis]|uniref:Uncharacterized protein n=1 Tax=Stephania yunnanensis TaxID=152371 RepID=A0AAP0J7S9_9MAGN